MTKPKDAPATPPTGGMWHNDIVFGGEQLEPAVTITPREADGTLGNITPYVLWDCGIVARNVVTTIGDDGTKGEVVISQIDSHGEITEPRKFGTFASAIVGKIELKQDGDLPAVVMFEKVHSDKWDSDAFVMTFLRRYEGDAPVELPTITTV